MTIPHLDLHQFKLPIQYNAKSQKLDASIIQDLELVQLLQNDDQDNDNDQPNKKQTKNKPLYEHVFSPVTDVGRNITEQIASYTTSDQTYLTEFQSLLKDRDLTKKRKEKDQTKPNALIIQMLETWSQIKGETSFCEKYSYIQWDFAKGLNTNPLFMQLMSIYNIASPIISLCSPLLILIIPFFVLKMKQIPITVGEYGNILKGKCTPSSRRAFTCLPFIKTCCRACGFTTTCETFTHICDACKSTRNILWPKCATFLAELNRLLASLILKRI